jgi:hypothetical protein
LIQKFLQKNMLKVIYKKDAVTGERLESVLLQILAYFSVFDFPLSADEIRRFLPPGSNEELVEPALLRLVASGAIFKLDKVYSLHNDLEPAMKKQQAYQRAQQLLPHAMKIGSFLCRFPYVRGIGISGSLSKMYAGEKADFDFFIITRADRLWIARTIMHLYKKWTFLRGRQHYHCMNYFLDEKALQLKDQNIYTAIETITLIPVCGEGLHDFFGANGWVSEWFATYPAVIKTQQPPATGSWIKKIMERVFNNRAGEWLDNYLMKLTSRRWKKKKQQGMLNYEGKEMSLLTGKHFARSNPDSFQQKTIWLYSERMKQLKSKWPGYFETSIHSFEE